MTRPSPRPAALALLLVASLALAACGTSGPSPSTTTPSASAPASAPAGTPAPCGRADLEVTSSGWGAGAGSRGSDVTVENAGGAACVLPPIPTVALFDATGAAILQNPVRVGGTAVTLEPGDTATFSFVASNWCESAVALPVSVSLVLADEVAGIAGLPVATVDDLPPCMGEGQPSSLSTTDWEAPA
jgi:hypothetical protein